MSWLLVAFIPGLLMLATFGLDKLESGLSRDTLSATDVADFLAQADADDVRTLARDGMGEALDCQHRRRGEHVAEPSLPTREASQRPVPAASNPQFRATRHPNRV